MTSLRELPERAMRATILSLSRQPRLGRLATRLPLTRRMVQRFVAGETLAEALDALDRLKAAGRRTTVDVLGESVHSEEAAGSAAERYLELLDALAGRSLDGNVSLKLSQMGLDVSPDLCRANVARIFTAAAGTGAFVRIDMEDHARTDATLGIWRALRSLNPASGVVIQAALRRSADDVTALIAERAPVRLCKGAYREPAAVAFPTKAEVDESYLALMARLLHDGTSPALATHDPRMIKAATELVERDGLRRDQFEFQMLYGVRRDLQQQLVAAGYRVRIYVPYGREWYPYFMRRLAERPANVMFILRSVASEERRRSS
jgi:proline dehydrogenase